MLPHIIAKQYLLKKLIGSLVAPFIIRTSMKQHSEIIITHPVSTISEGTFKTVLDAKNGFHSLLIDKNSRKYYDFITKLGVYQYQRGPQGYHCTEDTYTLRFNDITSNVEKRCINDGTLHDFSIENSFWQTFDHLKHCIENAVVFNRDKFVFAAKTVDLLDLK